MPIRFDFDNLIIQHIVYTVLAMLAIALLTRLGHRVVHRYIEEPVRRFKAYQIIRRIASLLALALLIFIWSPGEQNILTILTVIGAGLAISMREALLSIVGWMNLVIRAPYRQGDRIEINGVKGDVLDVRLFHSTMMELGGWVDADQSTGRLVHVPNSWVYLHPVYNYARGFSFIWNEIPVTLTFRSNWEAARDIMLQLAQESAAVVEQQAAREIRSLRIDARHAPAHGKAGGPERRVLARTHDRRCLFVAVSRKRVRRGAELLHVRPATGAGLRAGAARVPPGTEAGRAACADEHDAGPAVVQPGLGVDLPPPPSPARRVPWRRDGAVP